MRTCDMLTFLYYGFALWLVAPLVVECRVITSTGGLAWPDRYFSVGVYRAAGPLMELRAIMRSHNREKINMSRVRITSSIKLNTEI